MALRRCCRCQVGLLLVTGVAINRLSVVLPRDPLVDLGLVLEIVVQRFHVRWRVAIAPLGTQMLAAEVPAPTR